MPKSLSARILVALIILSGFLLLGEAIANTHSLPSARFLVLLALATVTARLRVKLPGLTGVMSVNLPFILLAVAVTGTAEALMVAFISTFAQCLPRQKQKFNAVQIAFNCCALMLAVAAARWIYTLPEVTSAISSPALRLAVAAVGYILVNTVAVSLVIALTEAAANLLRTWAEMVQLSFPYLVASAGVAGLAISLGQDVRWQVPLAVLPVMIGIFVSYRRFFTATTAQIVTEVSMEGTSAAVAAHG
jgi:hypothetical protein